MGEPGIYLMAILFDFDNNRSFYIKEMLESQYEMYFNPKNIKYLEDELLYGSAGYLFCLLKAVEYCSVSLRPELD